LETPIEELVNQINEFARNEFEMEIQFTVKEMDDHLDYRRVEVPDLIETVENPQYTEWKREHEETLGWCKIKETAMFVRLDTIRNRLQIFTKTQMMTAYEHECFEEITEKGKSITVCNVRKWLEDPNMRVYNNLSVFPRGLECPEDTFNAWTDSPYEKELITPDDEEWDGEALEAFLNHARILLGSPEAFKYVMDWIGHAFQFPHIKPPKLISLIGIEGTGKSLLVNTIGNLYGDSRVFSTANPERDVWGHFNSMMEGKSLIILNEIGKQNSFQAEDRIKDLIDAPTITISSKGLHPYTVPSYHRYMATTNNIDPVKTSKDDRRNILIRCDDSLKGNFDYFRDYVKKMSKPNALRTVYSYFRNLDIGGWDGTQELRTTYHKEIIASNTPYVEDFLGYWVINKYFEPRTPPRKLAKNENPESVKALGEPCEYISTDGVSLLADFGRWKERFGGKYDINCGTLMMKIKAIQGIKDDPDVIITRKRSSKGVTQYFHIEKLKAILELGEIESTEEDTDPEETEKLGFA
jgi:hypothetical protein